MRVRKYLIVLAVCLFGLALYCVVSAEQQKGQQAKEPVLAPRAVKGEPDAGVCASIRKNIIEADVIPSDFRIVTPEERAVSVYSFLQGPRAYGDGLPWSGSWCENIVGYNTFGGFGCGFCCMANIYSTLSDYECSPWDMYEYAISVSRYYPSPESGAIDWMDIRTTLRAAGFRCKAYKKPPTYEEFQEQMKQSQSAIVLVSSYEDDTFWKDTAGHYVNIWLYQQDTDMVFLAEPGDPENNRSWIPLRYVYDALKTVSRFQYLAVTSYTEEENTWKLNGIDEEWNRGV